MEMPHFVWHDGRGGNNRKEREKLRRNFSLSFLLPILKVRSFRSQRSEARNLLKKLRIHRVELIHQVFHFFLEQFCLFFGKIGRNTCWRNLDSVWRSNK